MTRTATRRGMTRAVTQTGARGRGLAAAGVGLATALGLAAAPAAAGAQGWREQITRQINNSSMIASARRDGYGDAAGPFYDLVAGGSRKSLRVTLEAGQSYRVIGKCDNDCSDLDLRLYDENDNLVTSDVETDDQPIVSVTPRRTATFRVEVAMATCSTSLCGWGVVVMGTGQGTGPGGGKNVNAVNAVTTTSANSITPVASTGGGSGSSTAWRDQIRRQLETSSLLAGYRRDGYSESHTPFYDLVPSGARRSTTVRLEAGRAYKFVGKCDNDCSDVDFKLYDENDNLISEDTATDDVPLVSVTPRRTAQFRLEVIMASCRTSQCGWGVAIVAK